MAADAENCVLLAVHNGVTYLQDQLTSLIDQTTPISNLYILDDHSNDGSHRIIESFIRANEDSLNCIFFSALGSKPLGPSAAFQLLAEVVSNQCSANVFFFCDQDDVWLALKVEKSIVALAEIMRISPKLPAFIFSDAYITDSSLNVVSNSMIGYQALPTFPNHSINEHLFQNNVSGFTVCCNRQALAGLTMVDNFPVIYDHWIALYCRIFGNWGYVDSPLALYRQHSDNAVGIRNYNAGSFWGIKKIQRKIESLQGMAKHIHQLDALVALMRNESIATKRVNEIKNLLYLTQPRSKIDVLGAWSVCPKRRGPLIRMAYFVLLIFMSRSR